MAKLWQFLQGPPKSAFSEKVQRGEQQQFFNYPVIIMTVIIETGEDLGAKGSSKSARMAKLWQFRQGHPKPAFSEKVQRGDQGKFLKNRPKSSPPLKGLKAQGHPTRI